MAGRDELPLIRRRGVPLTADEQELVPTVLNSVRHRHGSDVFLC